MSAASKVSRQLSSIAASWPADPFRPNLQLKNFFQSLSTHPNLTPKAVDAVDLLKNNAVMEKVHFVRMDLTSNHYMMMLIWVLLVHVVEENLGASFTAATLHPACGRIREEFTGHRTTVVESLLRSVVVGTSPLHDI
jgi:hypothetical protein